MQQQTLSGASTTPGHALQVGEDRKMAAHAGACRAIGVIFIPLVVESLGGWSQEDTQTIVCISRLQGQRLGIPPANSTRHLFQRLAISLWRGNASLWIRRQSTRSATVDGDLSHSLHLFFASLSFICYFIILYKSMHNVKN